MSPICPSNFEAVPDGRTGGRVQIASNGLSREAIRNAVVREIRSARAEWRSRVDLRLEPPGDFPMPPRWIVRKCPPGGWRATAAEVIACRCAFCGAAVLVLPWYTVEDMARSKEAACRVLGLTDIARWHMTGHPLMPDYVCEGCFESECQSSPRIAVERGLPLTRRTSKPTATATKIRRAA